jgi:UDP-N-acetylmuramate dehydrogenase
MDNAFIEKIKEVVGEKYVKENESMASHCTFRCGGNAELFVTPGSIDELTQVVALCRENDVEFLVIGNGSNLLVKDEGYKGVIIEVNSRISFIDVIGEDIVADAGAKLSAMENDLGGFEFAHGIPGNIGGAVMMNAGAYGGEMKQVLKWVKVLDNEGNIITLDASELEMGYRTSIIEKKGYIVLQARIGLNIEFSEDIGLIMQMFMQKRRASQPLEYPSAGSTFKRPEGQFAGKLIEDCGLRGYTVGGAQVSEKHCGFVVNKGGATTEDIMSVIRHVQHIVKEQTGYLLECEVKIIPYKE